ncbi:MAG: hypothetical protein HY401_05625 [Elusimicrobia bacterium]|nr:hypothetical protein [Elusimicrobiota bacterium]
MRIFSENEKKFIELLAGRVVARAAGLGAGADERFWEIIEGTLSGKPVKLQKQFKVFLIVIKILSFLRFGRIFERLGASQQEVILHFLQDGPIVIFRKGFWGLKALIFMGYYGRQKIGPEIHYTPSKRGNEMLKP